MLMMFLRCKTLLQTLQDIIISNDLRQMCIWNATVSKDRPAGFTVLSPHNTKPWVITWGISYVTSLHKMTFTSLDKSICDNGEDDERPWRQAEGFLMVLERLFLYWLLVMNKSIVIPGNIILQMKDHLQPLSGIPLPENMTYGICCVIMNKLFLACNLAHIFLRARAPARTQTLLWNEASTV